MSRANPTLVGAFVVGALAIAVGAAIALGAKGASSRSMPFVVHVEGSVNGLRIGAPVKFKGIQIGAVERIAIHLIPYADDAPVAVFCSIDEERLGEAIVGEEREQQTVPELVETGLRARLGTESMVTGILYISLMFLPDERGTRHGAVHGLPEVPALPSTTERLESGLDQLITKIQELDLSGLIDHAGSAAESIAEVTASPEIRSSLANLDQALASTRRIAESLERELVPMVDRLGKTVDTTGALASNLDAGVVEARETLASARKLFEKLDQEIGPFASSISAAATDVGTAAKDFSGTLDHLDDSTNPNSPLIVHLESSLVELAGAARAVRALLEHLERDPSQLLRGRAIPEGEDR